VCINRTLNNTSASQDHQLAEMTRPSYKVQGSYVLSQTWNCIFRIFNSCKFY